MRLLRIYCVALILLVVALSQFSIAETIDDKLTAKADKNIKRTEFQKLADKTAEGGWGALRAGRVADAKYRFDQAFLFDKSNGLALWGIAVIHANKGEYKESLRSFEKAEQSLSEDIDFNADYARTLGYAALSMQGNDLILDAFKRFGETYKKSPQHVLNLQNWAIILFYVGQYADAWEKIKLAEATPDSKYIDQKFIASLQSKMPRP